jgi:hypothetical protein
MLLRGYFLTSVVFGAGGDAILLRLEVYVLDGDALLIVWAGGFRCSQRRLTEENASADG